MSQKAYQILDIFAGAGGLSFGFKSAGLQVHAEIEHDDWACQTLRRNNPNTTVIQRDLTSISDDEIKSLFSVHLSGIVGGPPCQGFSHSNINNRDPRDPRNSLFREFARFVRILRPDFFVMEHVPGLLHTTLAG